MYPTPLKKKCLSRDPLTLMLRYRFSRVEKWPSHRFHTSKIAGSSPAPATNAKSVLRYGRSIHTTSLVVVTFWIRH